MFYLTFDLKCGIIYIEGKRNTFPDLQNGVQNNEKKIKQKAFSRVHRQCNGLALPYMDNSERH